MPAPDHLIPLLTALGNGGTVATADAVVAAVGGLPGHVHTPYVETVMGALGDGATRDVAKRVVELYYTAPLYPMLEAAIADAPVVNESVAPVPAELAEAIAATDPAAPEADASGGEDSDEDEWEASGLDEFAAPADVAPGAVYEESDGTIVPAADPEPVVEAPIIESVPAATVRAWAKANGVTCPARGAVPAAVREQYAAAQGAWRPGQTTSAIVSGA